MKLGDILKLYQMRCFTFPASTKKVEESDGGNDIAISPQREPGGWKSMPYIIGNETCERLATFGMFANFTVYLVNHLHLPQILAANVANIWFGTTNFAPLLGAYLSDVYLGRFQTLAYASVASFLGMLGLTLTASIPQLRPPPCSPQLLQQGQCAGTPQSLLAVLFLSLAILTIGAGGVRPCSLPFAIDQFDATTEKGRKGINSFFNWYYFTFNVAVMLAITVVVYVQDSVSWALGLGIPTILMLLSIVLFFLGTRFYIYVAPEGSIFSGIARVVVAAFKKRNVEDPVVRFFDPDPKNPAITKLNLTQRLSFLNKAAAFEHGEEEVNADGTPKNPWRLCSVQKVEELKCLLRIAPIWASGIICLTAIIQQGTFTVLQALKMDRHLGRSFQVPAGSFGVIAMGASSLFIPIYDRVLVPVMTKITRKEGGITLLQRMGIGMGIAIVSMVAAGMVEKKRRVVALKEGDVLGVAPISALWLAPQLVFMGISEALNGIAQIEFYYKEFPEHMRSIAVSLFFCSLGGASYLSSLIISLVQRYTGKNGRPNWLDNNINVGRVDHFYYLMAIMGVVNLVYFVICSLFYHYKGENDKKEVLDQKFEDEGEEKRGEPVIA